MANQFDSAPPGALPTGMIEWLLRLTNQPPGEGTHSARAIDQQLRAHPAMLEWSRRRPPLRNTPHFARYRNCRDRHRYDRAIEALERGVATPAQHGLVTALSAEVVRSPLLLHPGQVVLCGELDGGAMARRNRFLWATLHPLSATRSADLAPAGPEATRPTVYVLHLERSLPALLGRPGPHAEWDILLPRRLRISIAAVHHGPRYDIGEGSIGL